MEIKVKAKIFSFVRVSDNSIVASVRVARFVSETLGVPLCWTIELGGRLRWMSLDGETEAIDAEPLDVLLIVGGAYAFSKGDTLERLGAAIQSAGQVIWISQDYTVVPPKDESGAESPFRKAFRVRSERTGKPSVSFWTTVEVMSRPGISPSGHRCGEHSTYVNWNVLTMEIGREPKPWEERVSANIMLYYGSWRSGPGTRDRIRYFDRYFLRPGCHTLFSCPTGKAIERYPLLMHETKLTDLLSYAGQFGLGLYLEDGMSHKEFHSPANRFYEMLSAGLPMVFQMEAQRMMEKAGYEMSDYILWNAEEAGKMMERKEEILVAQRRDWLPKAEADRLALPGALRAAWSKLT